MGTHMGPASAQIERAWHLLTFLIRLGRPAGAAELSSLCSLSPAPSPELVELLCRVPGSPLSLSAGGLVGPSGTALAALGEFVARSLDLAAPRVAIRAAAQRREWGEVSLMYARKRKVRVSEDRLPSTKRRLMLPSPSERDAGNQLALGNWTGNDSSEAYFSIADFPIDAHFSTGMSNVGCCDPNILNQASALPSSLYNSNIVFSSFGSKNMDRVVEVGETEKICKSTQAIVVLKELPELPSYEHGYLDVNVNANGFKGIIAGRPGITKSDVGPATSYERIDRPSLDQETCTEHSFAYTCMKPAVQCDMVPMVLDVAEAEKKQHVLFGESATFTGHTAAVVENVELATVINCQNEGEELDNVAKRRGIEKSAPKDRTASEFKSHAVLLSFEPTTVWKQQRKSLGKPRNMDGFAAALGLKSSPGTFDRENNKDSLKKEQVKREEKGATLMQKLKKSQNNNAPTKGTRDNFISKVPKTLDPKLLPSFESFVIEEEEGSGGYGTVYRAQRKNDGKIFAIKFEENSYELLQVLESLTGPHANAHLHHVRNELKMLERFGGRNFVIKYEGSFKSGESECFVLEHVEHDRPEVLKKEIDVFELQWYGYCMFRALASLHKQGIVHRDVKPGNFLFSRKLNKGFLIDFNLAHDLRHKFFRNSRSDASSDVNLDSVSFPAMKPTSYSQSGKVILGRIDDSNRPLLSKSMRKRCNKDRADTYPRTDNKYGSQPADGSSITSTREPTSTRTSGDRLKQHMPCIGRKKLINFLHEAMQSPNRKGATAPASQRKRVAAPLGKMDQGVLIVTPMPLHSDGNAVAGAGMFNTRENRKQKREGPCVGTKGFRAPEVLFKSYHQGCKVDIWSAGVTILYLMIGRTPFGGDPEQNVKEIAKLRGSEDLWEMAKLHNCESSFPTDLLDVQSLQSTDLRNWCAANTRRPDFLELVPDSLFDLVDKCLTVNPRLRITAEKALMHDFFKPCHESLRKQRLLRRAAAASQPGTQS